jgi:hypothetical protein
MSLSDVFSGISGYFDSFQGSQLIDLYNLNDENILYLLIFSVAFICIFVVYLLAKCFHDKNHLLKNE